MLPPLILELRARANQVYSELGKVDAAVSETEAATNTKMGKFERSFTKAAGAGKILGLGVSAAALIVGVESTKMAANFQQASLRLVTDAGESNKNLAMVKAGMLDLSVKTGMSATDIAKGMYVVESAGYHGAAGLKVMQAAAEGAKIGGADVTTVTDALTTAMTDYHFPANQAAQVTSKLIATVGQGKTTMEALAGSLHNVMPTAQSLGISFDQVSGAMATMTAEGVSADQASQNLNHAINSLSNPTGVMTKEMAAMGLNSTTVAAQLGKKGLTGTLKELVTSITSHMGPAGLVLQNAFSKSQLAAQSAGVEYDHLGKGAQSLASQYEKGSITLKQWTLGTKAMSPVQANLAKEWASSYNASKAFSTSLTSNQGAAQTFTAALAKMTGGQQGLSVALHLTGDHMGAFENNVKVVSKASADAQGNVRGWKETQTNLNQQLNEARAAVQVLGIKIGTLLIPVVSGALRIGTQWTNWAMQHRGVMEVLGSIIGVVVVGLIGAYMAHLAVAAVNSIREFATMAASGASWAAEQAVSFGSAVASGAAWVATQLGQFAAWAAGLGATLADALGTWATYKVMQLQSAAQTAAGWVKSAAVSTAAVVKSGAQSVASGAANAAKWVATQSVAFAQATARGAAYTASLVASGAKQAAVWVKTTAVTIAQLVKQGVALVATKGPMLAAAAAQGIVTAAQWAWNVAMDANPIGIVILAIGALIAAIILVATHWQQITSFLTSAFQTVASVFVAIGSKIAAWWTGFWGGLISTGKAVFGGVVTVVSSIFNLVIGLFTGNTQKINSAWTGLWNGLKSIATGLFGGAGSWLVSAGQNIVNGLISGVTGMIGSAVKTVSSLAGSVVSAAKGALGIHSPSTVFAEIGDNVGHGLNIGLNRSTATVAATAKSLANTVSTGFGAGLLGITSSTSGEAALGRTTLSGSSSIGGGAASPTSAASRSFAQNGRSGAGRTGGTTNSVVVNAMTNASPQQIASSVGWELRRKG